VPSARFGHQLTEELVLTAFEVVDDGHQPTAGSEGGVGVALGARVLVAGERRLGDEGADAGVVGVVGEHEELLVENGQLLSGPDEPVVDVT